MSRKKEVSWHIKLIPLSGGTGTTMLRPLEGMTTV